LLAPFLAFAAETPTNEAPAPAKAACCAAVAELPYSRESIYQLEGKFRTDEGKEFSLGELRGRPVVLNMFFASCGYACPLQVTDMQAIRAQLPAALRDEVVFVLVSFDTVRDTPAALATYRTQRALDGQWRLLHGDDQAVRELAALLGVKYKQEADGMFAHSNIITLLNAQGEIIHQRIGLKGGLAEAAAALTAAVGSK
jgi:protein SCO1/2